MNNSEEFQNERTAAYIYAMLVFVTGIAFAIGVGVGMVIA